MCARYLARVLEHFADPSDRYYPPPAEAFEMVTGAVASINRWTARTVALLDVGEEAT